MAVRGSTSHFGVFEAFWITPRRTEAAAVHALHSPETLPHGVYATLFANGYERNATYHVFTRLCPAGDDT
jgi:hypothetical protein